MPASTKPITGTAEWAKHKANSHMGCRHGCRYCYARANNVDRFKKCSPEAWKTPRLLKNALTRKWGRRDGTIMYPTAHDITPDIQHDCIVFLANMLRPGNRVLIVTKPHLSVIESLCRFLKPWQSQVLFRFTISADDDAVLSYWEPGAPPYAERVASLIAARREGYATSVSVEPMLDGDNVVRLAKDLLPHITDTIWIGRLNKAQLRVRCETYDDRTHLHRVLSQQVDAEVRRIYAALKDEPKVRWKESFKLVLGLPLATQPGEDS